MSRFVLPIVLLQALLAAGCLVHGKSEEEKRAERAAAAAAREAALQPPGLDVYWREGELPPGLEEGAPRPGGTLVVRINANPPSLDPLLDSDWWTSRIARHNLLETLVQSDPRDHPRYRPIPALATSWEVSEDRLVYTFHLRDGVRWHDGRPFTSRDVKFTFDRILDPDVRAMHVRQSFVDLASVATPDERTVVLRFRKPFVWVLEKLAGVPILPAHAFEGYEGPKFNTAPYHRAPIGTGPFRFVSFEDAKAITFERNDEYWGKKAWVDRVVYRIVPEPNVAQQLLLRGEIDLDISLTAEQYVKLAWEPKVVERYHRVKYFENAFAWIGWNNRRELFRDARVRRALAMLLDRETVRTGLYEGLPELANCVFYHLGPGCDPATKVPDFDPEGAMRLLEEAGWRDTDGDGILDKDGRPFRFTMTIPSGNPVNEAVVLLYKQQLYRAGIEMELQKIEWSVYAARLRSQQFDACMLQWVSSDAEIDPFQIWHSSQVDGGSNYVGFVHPEIDRLAERVRSTFDPDERQAIYRRFNQLVIDEQPLLPIFHLPRRALVHRRLKGVYLSPMQFFQVSEIWIDPEWRG